MKNITIQDLRRYTDLLIFSFEGIDKQIDWLNRNKRLTASQKGFVYTLLKRANNA